MTNQPVWQEIAQLGDADPIDGGGYWIFEDTTGVYAPEGEHLASPDSDDAPEGWTVHRFSLDRCTLTETEPDHDGSTSLVLSDNPYHPLYPVWFAKDLAGVASFIGVPHATLRGWFCSEHIVDRAMAYQAIGDYHGFDNLDGYPLHFTTRKAVERRYAEKHDYEVVVGNIGSVYEGTDRLTALKTFRSYRQDSRKGYGRASGEEVTLFMDSEPEFEHANLNGPQDDDGDAWAGGFVENH